jgi:hypothetical protein
MTPTTYARGKGLIAMVAALGGIAAGYAANRWLGLNVSSAILVAVPVGVVIALMLED